MSMNIGGGERNSIGTGSAGGLLTRRVDSSVKNTEMSHTSVGGNVTGGLNPNRQRGFGAAFPRIETPRLSDIKAKQGAIVARFLTFFQRKTSLVIELYNAAFYRQKPTWDKIADFIHSDLCTTSELKRERSKMYNFIQ